jgi:hypothetical protein
MKKIILFVLVSLFITSFSNSQVKVNIQLTNRHVESGLFAFDVMAVIPSGQTWRVGSSNIRVDFYTVPSGHLTVHPDATVSGALTCLNSGNYSAMTTTSINGGTAISLNISRLATCCVLTSSGSPYLIGRIRFNIVDSTGCTHDTIRFTSVMQDSITALVYGTTWGRINPTGQDTCALLTGINSQSQNIPISFKLYDNYPNPFNPGTTIKYDVPKSSYMRLTIFDILGREVQVLVNEKKEPGSYEIKWNASNFASGTYFYKMETNAYTDIKKMILLK